MSPGSDDLSHVHEPVLVEEVLAFLLTERTNEGLVVDGTVGAGGHASAILEAAPKARVFGIDRDPKALSLATERLQRFGDRVHLAHGSYADLPDALAENELPAPHGVLLDFGASSMQFDDLDRGFSFRGEGEAPDMRFDPTSDESTAQEILNHASERDLAQILHDYGEEPRARAVARAIVRARPIRTIAQLRDVVRSAALRVKRHDAATRSFQALRIAVNDEFAHIERGLRAAIECLRPYGRLVVICFHSGEERLVKAAFRAAVADDRGRILTRKPVRPTSDEVQKNPRARPARLRAFERA